MILAILDCQSGRVTVFEKLPAIKRLRLIEPEELAQRALSINHCLSACENDEELAHMAMCGMLPAPYGPEDFTWR